MMTKEKEKGNAVRPAEINTFPKGGEEDDQSLCWASSEHAMK